MIKQNIKMVFIILLLTLSGCGQYPVHYSEVSNQHVEDFILNKFQDIDLNPDYLVGEHEYPFSSFDDTVDVFYIDPPITFAEISTVFTCYLVKNFGLDCGISIHVYEDAYGAYIVYYDCVPVSAEGVVCSQEEVDIYTE